MSPMNQLLLTLRLYATGTFFLVMADAMGVSQSTAHRITHKVTVALCRLRSRFIHLPRNAEELRKVQLEAYRLAGFPQVLGLIDGTHVKIYSPGKVST